MAGHAVQTDNFRARVAWNVGLSFMMLAIVFAPAFILAITAVFVTAGLGGCAGMSMLVRSRLEADAGKMIEDVLPTDKYVSAKCATLAKQHFALTMSPWL